MPPCSLVTTTGTIDEYVRYCRPKTGEFLRAARLDVSYHRGDGDRLYCVDPHGFEKPVWDFLGGYGSLMFGHNHRELVEVIQTSLKNGVPFSAQASCRSGAALLGKKLSRMMHERFGEDFVTTLASTGAEVTEAALKHAELQQRRKFQALDEKVRANLSKARQGLQTGRYRINSGSFQRLHDVFGLAQNDDFHTLIDAMMEHNRQAARAKPIFLAMTGSFHGKTTGAVNLTHNKKYRDYFSRLGIGSKFIPTWDETQLAASIEGAVLTLYSLDVAAGEVSIVEQPVCNVAGLFVEPIQGEGGIHVAPAQFFKAARALADKYKFPLIVDEIQTGMGRTGTWLYSEQLGCLADYYLLGKSLGGGLTKVAALLIQEKQYDPEFGFLHTSTFAEDDIGCRVAVRSLELLERERGWLMRNCVLQGEKLRLGLQKVQRQYPGVIKEVRGVGLLIGIELEEQLNRGSLLIFNLSRQKLLAPVVASHLLHESGVRVAPALSAAQVLRLEPSAYISDEAIHACVRGFERVCEVIYKQNMYELTKCLIGQAELNPERRRAVKSFRRPPNPAPSEEGVRKIAFIGHLIRPGDVKLADPTMAEFSDGDCDQLLRQIFSVYGMIQYEPVEVRSALGERVILGFMGLCFHSELIVEQRSRKGRAVLQEKILECVDHAVANNFSVVGFGGLSSVVMRNCLAVNRPRIGLTSGNAFTVAMGLEAIFKSAAERNIDLGTATFAGVGANGNICSTYCKMMADHVGRVILVGREGRESELERLATEIYLEALERVMVAVHVDALALDQATKTLTGVARRISETNVAREMFSGHQAPSCFDKENALRAVSQLRLELGDDAPVQWSVDLADLKHANLILGASSSPDAVIRAEFLGEGPLVICDVALPEDTHESVLERDDVTVILGGLVRLPLNPDFVIDGVPLPKGCAYACMSETLLLGLHDMTENYSVGTISKTQVKKISEIARMHGFKLGQVKREKSY